MTLHKTQIGCSFFNYLKMVIQTLNKSGPGGSLESPTSKPAQEISTSMDCGVYGSWETASWRDSSAHAQPPHPLYRSQYPKPSPHPNPTLPTPQCRFQQHKCTSLLDNADFMLNNGFRYNPTCATTSVTAPTMSDTMYRLLIDQTDTFSTDLELRFVGTAHTSFEL